jgi:Mycothiol maleylpyruvate isomerase N-terminal domain
VRLTETRRIVMGAKTEALAKQVEAKGGEAGAVLEKLTDADWKKVTVAEKWTVGVTAHHLAGGLEAVAGIIIGIVAGNAPGNFSMAMLDQMNAQHAKEHANCTKAETAALLRKGAATAAAVVRGLNDDQLAKSGVVFSDAPPMTAEQLIQLGLLNHTDEHLGSIRKTVGAP